ncbi:MAG: NADH-quinone oxidoreductase subunit [Thermoleophilaceae bacterium]|jgi:NADH-quinone oxidoreductase subunit G|nr:NADH-quinone oxidoreductase subunit [Thermoleophilaceae bacterium]MEA2471930.1 NADH-quinone oxidoreductase subunit [Thermoleophilaceae bacterium]
MPRPEQKFVTFEIDGREVSAPEGSMLVDGAKYGDVEIPVFCYEPKLGQPVGACRMCLVEIEGIPKLQTACSTAVKDGMVVITSSDRVKQAQNAIVEFLLVNHPLDCPVCDKGGECPLQDITFGWGSGRSRFIEPKRHFRKPLELSPLVAIDRERCILCYRCVRFSQEIAEDFQLVFLERADHTYVGTHDGRPYVAPFSGNIVELCPVGALTSTAYRFRARPWDIENAGSVCTLCPSQCNVEFTVRDDTKVLRVSARDNEEVDDGWLCDKGRFGYQIVNSPERITQPLVRDGGELRPVSWERALSEASKGLDRASEKTAALVGGEATNEEGYLVQFLMREVLGSGHVDSRIAAPIDPEQARTLARPDLSARVSDIDFAGTVLVIETELVDEAPILDLRVRKAARRKGLNVVVATSRPSSLDPNAGATLRFAPGAAEAALGALAAAITGRGDVDDLARRSGASAGAVRAAADAITGSGSVIVLWGERLSRGERGKEAVAALLATARALGIESDDAAGMIEVPSGSNGRGLREVGCLPNLKPGLVDADESGLGAAEIPGAIGQGDVQALLLFQADPLRTHADRGAWEDALDRANFVVGFSDFVTESLAEHANVVFPAESYAEKDGTVTHPDGRLQRVRQSIGRPGEVRPQTEVLLELVSQLSGAPLNMSGPVVFELLSGTVPFYRGLSYEEIGGRGVRWQDRDSASNLQQTPLPGTELETPPELPGDGLRLGGAPSLWAGRETEHAPVLRFLAPHQRAELSAEDARRLGVQAGDEVEVAVNGTSIRARAALRQALPTGSVFLIEGTSQDNVNALLTNGGPPLVEVRKP